MTKGRVSLPCASGGWWREPQVPPLRFAPVGMTIHILVGDASSQENFHAKKSQPLGMTKGRATLPLRAVAEQKPFFIPLVTGSSISSKAEFSATC
jgi:hypothetical protein